MEHAHKVREDRSRDPTSNLPIAERLPTAEITVTTALKQIAHFAITLFYVKVTLCNNLTLFEVWFYRNSLWYHRQLSFDSIWSCEGPINRCVFPTSHLGYALCSS